MVVKPFRMSKAFHVVKVSGLDRRILICLGGSSNSLECQTYIKLGDTIYAVSALPEKKNAYRKFSFRSGKKMKKMCGSTFHSSCISLTETGPFRPLSLREKLHQENDAL